jgi:hypothetical protein
MVQVLGVVGQSVNLRNPQTGNSKVLPLKDLDEDSLIRIIVDLGKRQSPTPGAESEQGLARSPVLVRYKSGDSGMAQVLGVVGQSVNLRNLQTGNSKAVPLKDLDEDSLIQIIADLGKRLTPIPGVVGSPCLVHDAQADQHYVAYRNTEGHIQEATFQNQQGSWRLIDATALAWAPAAAGEPTGLVSTQTGARYYVYRGQDGHLHELRFDGDWNHRDLGEIDK